MKRFFSSSIGWFRLVAFLEGTSYLFLLLVAMPLKHYYEMALAVTYTGWVHGGLFIVYTIILGELIWSKKWKFDRSLMSFVASLVPAGTFILDAVLLSRLHREEEGK